ncbi:metal/formaldehyde-sensitive transcriptional repressor [Acetobacteraceae bacterium KSS8]|uniref:Metal/formaldehyde-sensitive transcriptional repressor n=1 Tax=Endosaccharibacter trunci TaxID=2812733 RepID=A0ABT1W2K6_9PROT|nr:metal/formaldehyde-sensitive transcriptional repressor [Acetobacteraceae bacterium KSS8]
MRSTPKKPADAETIKLAKRLNRIRGQIDALQRALVDQGASSTKLLQQATACRGALDGFIAEVIEDHIREQVVQAPTPAEASEAAEELIGLVHSYLT